MKNVYAASLCRKGLLGGLMYVEASALRFCTNKLTVPEQIRRLQMCFSEIQSVEKAPLYTVLITMKDGAKYRFLIFARERFLETVSAQ